jgi:hypothetical protein
LLTEASIPLKQGNSIITYGLCDEYTDVEWHNNTHGQMSGYSSNDIDIETAFFETPEKFPDNLSFGENWELFRRRCLHDNDMYEIKMFPYNYHDQITSLLLYWLRSDSYIIVRSGIYALDKTRILNREAFAKIYKPDTNITRDIANMIYDGAIFPSSSDLDIVFDGNQSMDFLLFISNFKTLITDRNLNTLSGIMETFNLGTFIMTSCRSMENFPEQSVIDRRRSSSSGRRKTASLLGLGENRTKKKRKRKKSKGKKKMRNNRRLRTMKG